MKTLRSRKAEDDHPNALDVLRCAGPRLLEFAAQVRELPKGWARQSLLRRLEEFASGALGTSREGFGLDSSS